MALRFEFDDEPIRLRPEDSAPTDPQALGIELMRLLRTLATDALDVRDTLARWGDDPISAHRRAQGRAVEVADAVSRAHDLGEQLMRAIRAQGQFSAPYSTGGRDGR